jgi:hypothetical protein
VQLAFDALYNAADVPLMGLMHASASFGTALGDGSQESWEAAQAGFGASFGFAVLQRRAEIAQEQAEASALTRARITQQSRDAQAVPPRTAAPPNRVSITSPPADVVKVETPDVAGAPEPAVETPASPPRSQLMLPAPRQPRALLAENAESLANAPTLRINRPSILRESRLSAADRTLLENDLNIKMRSLQSAARRGELRWSPGTDEVRISDLQAAYRARVIGRFQRRFGFEPDISRLDADHVVDLIVGGAADQRLKLIHMSINRSIGSSLKSAGERLGLQPGDRIGNIIINP